MATLAIALGTLILYLIAYHTYGRFLARKVFRLDPAAPVPSVALNDDQDFVPTKRGVVFGHHFTSIAGTGPIVGPAIAVMWGWVPALLWVVFGSILIGAVHDFGALVVSLRNRGQTVGDIAGRVLNPRVRTLFLLILFMALTIVLAIFGLVIANVFTMYPASIFPCVVQAPIAIAIGFYLHRKGVNLFVPSLIALTLMYVSVIYGDVGVLHTINMWMASWSVMMWVIVLLLYSYAASVLPVWSLLQPRDYINSLQLISALGLIVAGLCVAAFAGGAPPVEGAARQPLEIVAPAINWSPAGAPIIFPFLFITIACGAISGFHCLVSSGTSSKQLRCETDAHFVGYGSMLTEGFLATLVILACVAGLGLGVLRDQQWFAGTTAWEMRYASWQASGGLRTTVGAFVDGSANFLRAMGIPAGVAVALMGVLVASFAGTTMDTACRLQRYVIQELGASTWNPVTILRNKHVATIVAVTLAAVMAVIPATTPTQSLAVATHEGGIMGFWHWLTVNGGKGGMILWPMFGATNQLLGGLAFLVITFWLWRRRLPVWFAVPPMIFMLIMPAWAMIWQLFIGNEANPAWMWAEQKNYVLLFVGVATLALEGWMIVEAALLWPRVKGVLEELLPPLRPVVEDAS